MFKKRKTAEEKAKRAMNWERRMATECGLPNIRWEFQKTVAAYDANPKKSLRKKTRDILKLM